MNTKQQKLFKCLRTLYPQDTVDISKNKHGNEYILIVSRSFDRYLEHPLTNADRRDRIMDYLLRHGWDLRYLEDIAWILLSPQEIKGVGKAQPDTNKD